MKKRLIGCHVSMKAPEYMKGAIQEALSYKANCFMIYTGAPQNTRRTELSKLKVQEYLQICQENNIDPKTIIVHAPYIVNLCSSNEQTREFAKNFLIEEIKRVEYLKAKFLVLHPGSHTGQGEEIGKKIIIEALKDCLEKTNNDVIICLETMAGKGSEIGVNFKQIADIINAVKSERIAVCLDTCHIHDSGYDLSDLKNVLEEFQKLIGIDKLKVIHLNDSKNIKGSKSDRHENIGYGKIGFQEILKVLDYAFENDIPAILETPYIGENAPYKKEIEILRNRKWTDFKNGL